MYWPDEGEIKILPINVHVYFKDFQMWGGDKSLWRLNVNSVSLP